MPDNQEHPGLVAAQRVYLDYAAGTPMDPRVVDAMLPHLTRTYGNPSSLHRDGVEAASVLFESRSRIAAHLGAAADEMVFTASGTESNNLALKGVALGARGRRNHIIISAIEHACVKESCRWLSEQGFAITELPVDGDGIIDPEQVRSAVRPSTVLVSIMHANNEIGVIQPIREIGAICRAHDVLFHTDACQSFGKVPFHPPTDNVDLATINAHKMYGPRGVGALFVRKGIRLTPWVHGGGQEAGVRSATENVAGIVGFAHAVDLCIQEMELESAREAALRDGIISYIEREVPGAYVNGHRTKRLPCNVNVGFAGLEGQSSRVLLELDRHGFAVSTGSACSSLSGHGRSHVLTAIGRDPVSSLGALRVSMGRFTKECEIASFLEVLCKVLNGFKRI